MGAAIPLVDTGAIVHPEVESCTDAIPKPNDILLIAVTNRGRVPIIDPAAKVLTDPRANLGVKRIRSPL